MTSWHLNIWKSKIWLSQERKELSRWNKEHFSLFHKSSLRHTKQTSKNVADATFNMCIAPQLSIKSRIGVCSLYSKEYPIDFVRTKSIIKRTFLRHETMRERSMKLLIPTSYMVRLPIIWESKYILWVLMETFLVILQFLKYERLEN